MIVGKQHLPPWLGRRRGRQEEVGERIWPDPKQVPVAELAKNPSEAHHAGNEVFFGVEGLGQVLCETRHGSLPHDDAGARGSGVTERA